LNLHFGDGSRASLVASRSRLVAARAPTDATVDVHFDDRALALLFDAQRRPADQVLEGSLDVRGPRAELLAAWRCFSILSQRASGRRGRGGGVVLARGGGAPRAGGAGGARGGAVRGAGGGGGGGGAAGRRGGGGAGGGRGRWGGGAGGCCSARKKVRG